MLLKRAFQHHSQSAYADFASYLLLSAAVMHSLSKCLYHAASYAGACCKALCLTKIIRTAM